MIANPNARSMESDALTSVLLFAGALCLLVTSACYALAGPVAALPGGAPSGAEAVRSTTSAAVWLRWIGVVAQPGNLLLAIACLLRANEAGHQGAGRSAAGWSALAVSSILFVPVDAIAAHVLPAVALGELALYSPWRALFDALFIAGGLGAGCGGVLIAADAHGRLAVRSRVRLGFGVGGGLTLVASAGAVMGIPCGPLIGPGIAALAVCALASAWPRRSHRAS